MTEIDFFLLNCACPSVNLNFALINSFNEMLFERPLLRTREGLGTAFGGIKIDGDTGSWLNLQSVTHKHDLGKQVILNTKGYSKTFPGDGSYPRQTFKK